MPSPGEQGKLYLVGTGPGDLSLLTERARMALEESTYILGNGVYLDFLDPLIAGKQVIRSSMGKEVERAEQSIKLAGIHVVSLVSGGDAGVYGMASIVLEVIERQGIDVRLEIIPGITAAQAAASRLGSPLSGDFVVISLSDLLTPWEKIEQRLGHAFSMGVPVALYNPRSRGRPDNLQKALEIAGKHLADTVPVGVVRNAYREEEEVLVTTLGGMRENLDRIDMHSTVIIGGEETRIWRRGSDVRGIITPRGYHRKYTY
ncbi:MAG: precorrin-3B C(17)-methyltransferase [Methanomicrobiales archaeon]|nr:precorrin-3B C(17)-methyltransferase [Methanomicrobiales archaeon]